MYKKLQIKLISLFILKLLRNYNNRFLKRSITHYILSTLIVNNYNESIYSILITPLK